MPEHDHGESEALVVPLAGELVLSGGDGDRMVRPGTFVHLDRGERVRVSNPTSEPASILAVFTPPAFVGTLAAWPVAEPSPPPAQVAAGAR